VLLLSHCIFKRDFDLIKRTSYLCAIFFTKLFILPFAIKEQMGRKQYLKGNGLPLADIIIA
jgi:hypothetical protein